MSCHTIHHTEYNRLNTVRNSKSRPLFGGDLTCYPATRGWNPG